jgi:regulator of replication initiation timing
MTEQIQKSITLLRTKFMGLHQNLVSAKEQIAALSLENEKLKSALNNVEESRTLLEADLEKAKLEVVAANKQVVNSPLVSQGRNNEQIDELVKEIENCIASLKK